MGVADCCKIVFLNIFDYSCPTLNIEIKMFVVIFVNNYYSWFIIFIFKFFFGRPRNIR